MQNASQKKVEKHNINVKCHAAAAVAAKTQNKHAECSATFKNINISYIRASSLFCDDVVVFACACVCVYENVLIWRLFIFD